MNNRQGEVKSSDSGRWLRVRWWGGHTAVKAVCSGSLRSAGWQRRWRLCGVWPRSRSRRMVWLRSNSKRCGVGMKLKADDMTIPFPPLFSFLSFTFFSRTQHFPVPFNCGEMNQNSLKTFYLSTWASTSGPQCCQPGRTHTHTHTTWTHPHMAGPHCTRTHTHSHCCWVGLMSVQPLQVHHSEAHTHTRSLHNRKLVVHIIYLDDGFPVCYPVITSNYHLGFCCVCILVCVSFHGRALPSCLIVL